MTHEWPTIFHKISDDFLWITFDFLSDLEVAEAVLHHGADVDRATDHGATPLYMAAQLSCTTMYRGIAAP